MKKVVSRLKGGLGNQLFCYAAARRLALVNGAELVVDDVTGFLRDQLYHREYSLAHFEIPVRKATPWERLQPFERYRRGVKKMLSKTRSFAERKYLEQEGIAFDPRLLDVNVDGTLFLDGLWQSEDYFKDVEATIREDLRIIPPTDAANQALAKEICRCEAVALHLRWFDAPDGAGNHNVSEDYYREAIVLMATRLKSPSFFVFSDDPSAARRALDLPTGRAVFVSNNKGDANAYADLWLMTQCRHFITANSTFSWWGAWLGAYQDKLVVTPDFQPEGKTAWGFEGLIPDGWLVV
jgi:hypothetical protein